MYFREWFAYYDLNMLNLNYLYMLVFKFGLPDQLTKIIHASFLVGGAYLIFRYFKGRYGFNWAAFSFIIYVTIPIHQRLASEVYVDLGLLFFSTLSIIHFVKWFESGFDNVRHLILSAIGAGLGSGTKYNGFIFAFFMALFITLIISREKKSDKMALKAIFLYGSIILLCISPWITRNYINSGNPFYPLFRSVIQSHIILPHELTKNVEDETVWRIVSGRENSASLFLLPVRVFFQGRDNDMMNFDGVLNPIMLLLLPFLFLSGTGDSDNRKKHIYLLIIFAAVFLTTLYSNNIRIRYFIPVYPILVFLNIESLKALCSEKKLKLTGIAGAFIFLLLNIVYSADLFKTVHLSEFTPFDKVSKQDYLKKHLILYDMYDYINNHTPQNSVIYEAFTGGRSYYIDRVFYSDSSTLDRYLLSLAEKGAVKEDYLKHFSDLPNSGLKATHLLIRNSALPHAFFNIYYNVNKPDEPELNQNLNGYYNFIKELTLLKKTDGVNLYKITCNPEGSR